MERLVLTLVSTDSNKPKFFSAQLSVNVVAVAVIEHDADADAHDATYSTAANFEYAATFATFCYICNICYFCYF